VKRLFQRLSSLEPAFVILAAPTLLFPTVRPSWTVAALALLLLVWLVRGLAGELPGIPTLLDVSLLLLVIMIPVAVWASAFPELTLPKLTGLILGLAAFRAVVNWVRTPRSLVGALAVFFLLGFGLMVAGAISTDWADKWPALGSLLAGVPRLIEGLPGAEAGVNANELGGALLLFLPVSLAACMTRFGGQGAAGWAIRLLIVLLSLLFGVVLVLTQSRSAWIGAVAGLAAMALLRWRWARWLLPPLALAVVLVVWFGDARLAFGGLFPVTSLADAGGGASAIGLKGRVELWNRALYAIQDFPLTGCGLGTFRQVVHLLYPLFFVEAGTDLAHAHNAFLQVALDLGLPGLTAYLALVGTALWAAWRMVRSGNARHSWLALGLVGSLVAFHVYGLADAIALGAKPGLAFWLVLALIAALWNLEQSMGAAPAPVDVPSSQGDL
jgi:putative inorganic carbon (HCO3(-)) transporter